MKVTKDRLKQIIKEELMLILEHDSAKDNRITDNQAELQQHCSDFWGPAMHSPQKGTALGMGGDFEPFPNDDYHKCMKYGGWPVAGYQEP